MTSIASAPTLRLIVTGPTGATGGAVVRAALADPRIARVLAVSRRPLSCGRKATGGLVPRSPRSRSTSSARGQRAIAGRLGVLNPAMKK